VSHTEHLTGRVAIQREAACIRPILLIESNFQYSVAISRAFKELELLDCLIICVDCENALMRLRQANGSRPCLILLDLEMPRMSAVSFLRAVKNDSCLQTIPVVALSESDAGRDVSRCYSLGAAGYMVKPANYAELLDKVTAICSYWSLSTVPVAD
jgi:DNA-binding response OmpR family regulator